MNSKCGVQSKTRCESHESCVCIVGFPACGCQKKSVVYETECRQKEWGMLLRTLTLSFTPLSAVIERAIHFRRKTGKKCFEQSWYVIIDLSRCLSVCLLMGVLVQLLLLCVFLDRYICIQLTGWYVLPRWIYSFFIYVFVDLVVILLTFLIIII